MAKKTWAQKRDACAEHKIETTAKKFADIPADATMLIPTPKIVDDYIRQIPKGSSSSIIQMRKDLAARFAAAYTCPVTSGIFVRIAAEAAWEEKEQGKPVKELCPFWRIIAPGSPQAKKLSFGTAWLLAMHQREKIFM